MIGSKTRGSEDAEYRALVTRFPPRPIRDDGQLAATQARVDELLALELRTPAEDDYLDLLSDLIRAWEDAHVDIPPLSGVELVKTLLEERGLPQRALTSIFGARSIVSEVLSGKRELQRKHIEGLAEFFHVSPAAFFPPRREKVTL
jgi:HTH-type transcriptional regulator/antitoxin HigA